MKKLTVIATLAASPAMAHPGHGEAAGHWLSSADHLAALALAAFVISAAVGLLRKPD